MTARISLQATLSILENCLGAPSLVDGPPNATAHNAQARFLRQGLAVLVFSAMESFIRERAAEVLLTFNHKSLSFNDLSPALQKATTIGALEGVRFRLRLQPAISRINWLSTAIAPIASAPNDISNLSKHSFGHAASNLDEEDVDNILRAFGLDAPWHQMNQTTSRCGITVMDCKTEFIAIKERRHDAAHALTANVLHPDLVASVRSARAICLAFDLLLSNARNLFNAGSGPGLSGRPKMTHSSLNLVFMKATGVADEFQFRKEPASPTAQPPKVIRRIKGVATALQFAERHVRRNPRHVVVQEASGTASDWVTC
ncbi:MAG: hypothetical protein J7598_25570 [Mitsuaria chitosanitabida]|uniref:HEPN domain-containing protein n=1 Tax=Roseateles chitosanitabidus TaxID=65048 RepID=UPI001B0B6384|nr:hypothetical protein [Roseateles chitosanitabidus]